MLTPRDPLDPATGAHVHLRDRAFREEELVDLARTLIAEELPEFFLVVSNPMFLDQRDEILRHVAGAARAARR